MTVGCRWAWGLLAGAIALGSTTAMSGAAVRDRRVSPNAVDPALLNAGNYPVKPRPPLGPAGATDVGALLDAQHLADYVTGPWEVDPALITPIHFGAYPANTDDVIPNFPGSHCQPDDDAHTSFSCAAAVERYMFSVWGHTLKGAQRQADAQYLILAAA